MQKLIMSIIAVLFVLLVESAQADSMRCSNYIVENGDTKGDVLFKCGEPVSQSEYQEQLREGVDQSREVRTTFIFNDWVYNFGPDRFMQIVTFRNGRVVEIRSGDYGYSIKGGVDTCRDGQLLREGYTLAEVELKCGHPAYRERSSGIVIDKLDRHTGLRRTISIDEWMYNFGPTTFIRYLRFENGRLVKIETGGYGY